MDGTPCPKCSSRTTHVSISRSQYMGSGPDMIFHCRTCGTRIYGPEKVQALVAAHKAAVQAVFDREEKRKEEERRWLEAAAEAERKEKDEEARAAKAAAEAARKAARKKALEAEILRNAKCAWPPCPNDHTMTSRYCSKTCRDRASKARQKEAVAARPPPAKVEPSQTKCALPSCQNAAAVNSKYCGRTCNDRNAHERAKARKLAQSAS